MSAVATGFVPVARGEHQRREAAGRVIGVLPLVDRRDVTLAIRIRARREQRLDHVRGGLPLAAHISAVCCWYDVGGVHVRARVEQQPHRVDAAGARRGHQRRLAVRMRDRDVGPGLQQRRDQRRVTGAAGLKQRRDAVMIRRVDGGASGNQRLCHLEIGMVGRPEKRRRSVARGLVDVRALGNQRANRLQVIVLGGSDQRGVARGLSTEGRKDERRKSTDVSSHLEIRRVRILAHLFKE